MYKNNNIFPLKEAYNFAKNAKKVGRKFAKVSRAIEKHGSIPSELEEYDGSTSQARRVLMYLLFLKYGKWKQFEKRHWPKNEGKYRIINDLIIDYIDSGRLAKCKNLLQPEIRVLVPWQDSS